MKRVSKIILMLFATVNVETFAQKNFYKYKNPFSIDVSSLPTPEFNESEDIPELIILDTDPTEIVDEQNTTETTETVDQSNVVDFNHTKDAHESILKTNPTFTESEEVPDNTESDVVPILELNTGNDDNDTKLQYKNPDNKNPLEVTEPVFTENENIPTRDTNEIVPDIPKIESRNDWETALDIGYNWRSVDWFGTYYETDNSISGQGWIYHANLGWLYLSSSKYTSVWVYFSEMDGWFWTNLESFPYLYGNKKGTWVFYDQNSDIFYDFLQKEWLINKR